MNKWISKIEFVSSKAVCAMASVILGVFTYWAGVSTHMTYVELENLKVREFEDSFIKNIGCLAVVLLLLWCFFKLFLTSDEGKNKERVRIFAVAAAILAGILSILWIHMLGYEPIHDQLQIVQDAWSFLQGDYSDLKGYLEIYPHQVGLVFLYELLFSIWPNERFIYYVHVLWLMLVPYSVCGLYRLYAATVHMVSLFGRECRRRCQKER